MGDEYAKAALTAKQDVVRGAVAEQHIANAHAKILSIATSPQF